MLIEFAEGIPLLGDFHLSVDWFRSPNRVDRSSALSSSATPYQQRRAGRPIGLRPTILTFRNAEITSGYTVDYPGPEEDTVHYPGLEERHCA